MTAPCRAEIKNAWIPKVEMLNWLDVLKEIREDVEKITCGR